MTGLVLRTLGGSFLGPIGGILGAVGGALGNAFRWVVASLSHILAVCLALSLVWGAYERNDASKWHRTADHAVAAYDGLVRDTKNAQAAAERAAHAARAANESASLAGAIAQDAAAAVDSVRAADAVGRYASAHRVRPTDVAGASGKAVGPGLPVHSEVSAGSAQAAGLLTITEPDLNDLAKGALQGRECAIWNQSLIDRGLALAVP